MKTIHNKNDAEEMKARIEKLTHETVAKWGKFDVHGMICHLQDALKYPLGLMDEVTELAKGPPIFMRRIIGLYVPIPKGKVQTSPIMLTTKPEEFDKDKAVLLDLMDRYVETNPEDQWPMHPFFGHLTGTYWGKLSYRHSNHHLTQFGV
ncbi:MAG: hypothetical protein GY940_27975 [bacterium]|nr:hypothetical protein [bacterium]